MPFSMLHPALFGLGIAAVSIPILLHLLKRKRRPIEWAAMRFLEQAFRKRRRILTIEQLILLVLRCALLVLIALGVGSLMLGSGTMSTSSITMVIVIDDSIGSALQVDAASSFDLNKGFALRALDELDAARGDRVMLIGSGMPARGIVVPETSDLGAVRDLIRGLGATDSGFDLDGALALSGTMGSESGRTDRRVLVIASGGRGFVGGRAGPGSSRPEFDRIIAMNPTPELIENIGITDALATRSLVTQRGVRLPIGVRVGLVRSGAGLGQDSRSTTITVFDQEDNQIGQRRVEWTGTQDTISAVVAIDPGSIRAMGARTAIVRVRIDDDANSRDNTRLVSVATRSSIRVGLIAGPNNQSESSGISPARWVRAALGADDRFGISILDIDAGRASALLTPNLDAVVVLAPGALDDDGWARLAQLRIGGTLVLITPDAAGGSLGWLDRVAAMADGFLEPGSVQIEHERPRALTGSAELSDRGLLSGIRSEFDSLANTVSVSRSIRLPVGSASLSLVLLDDGSAMALESNAGDGRGVLVVFGSAFDLEWTNLPTRPLFVAMMQEIVRQGVGVGSAMPVVLSGERIEQPVWSVSWQRVGDEPSDASQSNQAQSARAGIIAQLDAQGVTKGYAVVVPDAQAAITTPTTSEKLGRAVLDWVGVDGDDAINWIEPSIADGASGVDSGDEPNNTGLLGSSASGKSIALWMLWGAGFIAVVEFVLARLFTVRLFDARIEGSSG